MLLRALGKIIPSLVPSVRCSQPVPLSCPFFLINRVCFAATASYRLLPHIILDEANPVPPHLATRFRDCFSSGVINVDPRTKKVSVDKAGVRGETMSREVSAASSRPCRVCQARACTESFHLYVSFSLAYSATHFDTWARFCSQRRVRGTIRATTTSARSPSRNEGKNLGIEECCRGAPRPRRSRCRYRDGRYVKTNLSIITLYTSLAISPSGGPSNECLIWQVWLWS